MSVDAAGAHARRFVLIGQTASASGEFSTENLPSSSGRLDVLLRAVRAALLISHGVRREAVVYLVLRGGPRAPRVLRIRGHDAKFLRPDERSLAILVKKSLAAPTHGEAGAFREVRPGVCVADGDLECVLADAPAARYHVLEETGADARRELIVAPDMLFFIGDHLGFDEATRARLVALPCQAISIGPVSLHSDDVVAVLSNELDRRMQESGAAVGAKSPQACS
jgi:tRNA (pseudouridine54-N1)-methyltransferase